MKRYSEKTFLKFEVKKPEIIEEYDPKRIDPIGLVAQAMGYTKAEPKAEKATAVAEEPRKQYVYIDASKINSVACVDESTSDIVYSGGFVRVVASATQVIDRIDDAQIVNV